MTRRTAGPRQGRSSGAAAGWVIWPGEHSGFVVLTISLNTLADALMVAWDRREEQRLIAALTARLPAGRTTTAAAVPAARPGPGRRRT